MQARIAQPKSQETREQTLNITTYIVNFIAPNLLVAIIVQLALSKTKKRGQAWTIRSSATSAAASAFFCRHLCTGSPRRAALLSLTEHTHFFLVEVRSIGAQPLPTLSFKYPEAWFEDNGYVSKNLSPIFPTHFTAAQQSAMSQ